MRTPYNKLRQRTPQSGARCLERYAGKFMKKILKTIAISIFVCACSTTAPTVTKFESDGWSISNQPRNIDEIEDKSIENMKKRQNPYGNNLPIVPFGRANSDWESFKKKVVAGDEVRAVKNQRKGIGYAIIRNGVVIDTFLYMYF